MQIKLFGLFLMLGLLIPSAVQANYYFGPNGQAFNSYAPFSAQHANQGGVFNRLGYNLNSMPGGGGWGGFPPGYHGLPAGYGPCSAGANFSINGGGFGFNTGGFNGGGTNNLSPGIWTGGFGGFYSPFVFGY
jgi:hypothetical protein